MDQQLKALISAGTKKFISSQLFNTNFYFKGTQQFTRCFPNHDWLCHLLLPFVYRDHVKKVAKGDEANHGWAVNCCVPLKRVKVCNK